MKLYLWKLCSEFCQITTANLFIKVLLTLFIMDLVIYISLCSIWAYLFIFIIIWLIVTKKQSQVLVTMLTLLNQQCMNVEVHGLFMLTLVLNNVS